MRIRKIVLLAPLCALLFLSCSQGKPDPDYQKEAAAFVGQIEKLVVQKDPVKFNALCSRSEANGLYKLLALFSSLFEKDKPEYNIVTLVPREYSPAEVALGSTTEVRIKVTLVYTGRMRVLSDIDKDVSDAVAQLVNLGLPPDMDLWLVYDKGSYKLKDYSFSPLYSLAVKGLELLL